jgi:hypothetical protein
MADVCDHERRGDPVAVPEYSVRPDMAKVRKVLDAVPGDDAGALYVTAVPPVC